MRRILVAILGLSALALLAQDPGATPAAPPKWEVPKPGPEMAKLKLLMGSFSVEERHPAGAMGPAGGGKGVCHTTMGPGGFTLVIDYTATTGVMKGMKGHGLLGWDAEVKAYKQFWTDSNGPMMVQSMGDWDGDRLVMKSEGTMMGKAYKEQDVYSDITAKGFKLDIQMSMGDVPMQSVMTLTYHRMAAKPPAPKAEEKK